jgi:hypothetical protein
MTMAIWNELIVALREKPAIPEFRGEELETQNKSLSQ